MLVTGIAARLGIDHDCILAAYEDPTTWLVKEGNLPENTDPLDPKIEDAEERNRMIRTFARGLTTPSGYRAAGATLERASGGRAGASEKWKLRRGRLFLVPGNSPVGYRLPLSSLPWVPPSSYPFIVAQDPLEDRGALPDPAEIAQRFERGASGVAQQERVEQHIIEGAVRTALSVEPRDGAICVFMPPVETLEDYLELLASVEATAAAERMPVHIEGYPPPFDPRLDVIKVTPDPGVIEVNVHPAATWRAAVATTKGLYEDARHARLGADKFMTDGRHTGTGGGNHIVFGGPTPGRLALPAPARHAEEPGALLAAPSLALLSLLGPFHRPDEPGAARRRSAARPALRARDRARQRAEARASMRRCGSSIVCSAICSSIRPATRIAPKSASTSFIRRTARPAASALSSSALSKCRRTRA